MEADYGAACAYDNDDDIDDDRFYRPSSDHTSNVAEDEDNEDDGCGGHSYSSFPDRKRSRGEGPSNAIGSGKQQSPQQQQQQQQRALPSIRQKKKKRRKPPSPVELFYELVLRWDANHLHSRKQLGLQPVTGKLPSYFPTKHAYFDALRLIAVEEARASLAQGMQAPEGQMHLRLVEDRQQVNDHDSDLQLVEFEVIRGSLELTKPGWCFVLVQQDITRPSSLSSTSNSVNERMLAVVAQGSRAVSIAYDVDSFVACGQTNFSFNGTRIPLWVHRSCTLGKALKSMGNGGNRSSSTWVAHALASVLSYQRMAAACGEYPSPPFLSKLIGHKPSSHIKFDVDDACDESDVGGLYNDSGCSVSSSSSSSCSRKSSSSSSSCSHNGYKMDLITEPSTDDWDSDDDEWSDATDQSSSSSSSAFDPNTLLIRQMILSQLDTHKSNARRLLGLNESQLLALHACVRLGDDPTGGGLQLVVGPPGCGKTHWLVTFLHVLLEIASRSMRAAVMGLGDGDDGEDEIDEDREGEDDSEARQTRQMGERAAAATAEMAGRGGLKVLVCAPSNKAVCVAVEQFLRANPEAVMVSPQEPNKSFIRCALVGVEDKMSESSSSFSSSPSSTSDFHVGNGPSGDVLQPQQGQPPGGANRRNRAPTENRSSPRQQSSRHDGTASNPVSVVSFPEGLLPSFVSDITGALLLPSTANDVFVYTFGQRVSSALKALALCAEREARASRGEAGGSGGPGGLGGVGGLWGGGVVGGSRFGRGGVGGGNECAGGGRDIDGGGGGGISLASSCGSGENGSFASAERARSRAVLLAVGAEMLSVLELLREVAVEFFGRYLKEPWRRVRDALRRWAGDEEGISGGCVSGGGEESEGSGSGCGGGGGSSSNSSSSSGRSRGTEPLESSFSRLSKVARDVADAVGGASDELAEACLRSADVVFCTLATAGHSIVKRNVTTVDLLIVDEAAQALEAELAIPFALGCGGAYPPGGRRGTGGGAALVGPRHLVLVGDPKQLPATVLSAENASTGRGKSAMQRLIDDCAFPALLLDTQYRMHSEISSLPNRLFYGGCLRDSLHVKRRRGLLRMGKGSVEMGGEGSVAWVGEGPTAHRSNAHVHNRERLIADNREGPNAHNREGSKALNNTGEGSGLRPAPGSNGFPLVQCSRGHFRGVGEGCARGRHWMQAYAFIDVPGTGSETTGEEVGEAAGEGEGKGKGESKGVGHGCARERNGTIVGGAGRGARNGARGSGIGAGGVGKGGDSEGSNGPRLIPIGVRVVAQQEVGGESRVGSLGSYRNEREARVISRLAAFLTTARDGPCLAPSQIAIITFYTGQVACIKSALRADGIGQMPRVSTVDSFQGSEADVVILSFVRSNPKRSIGFLKDFQRLNVALTRAKHLLLAVGCAATLQGVCVVGSVSDGGLGSGLGSGLGDYHTGNEVIGIGVVGRGIGGVDMAVGGAGRHCVSARGVLTKETSRVGAAGNAIGGTAKDVGGYGLVAGEDGNHFLRAMVEDAQARDRFFALHEVKEVSFS